MAHFLQKQNSSFLQKKVPSFAEEEEEVLSPSGRSNSVSFDGVCVCVCVFVCLYVVCVCLCGVFIVYMS